MIATASRKVTMIIFTHDLPHSINQSINQSFILTRCVEELENLFKIRTCINIIYNNYS